MTTIVRTIALYHLRKQLFSRSFFFSVIGMPLVILAAVTIGILAATMAEPERIGVVDPANVLKQLELPEASNAEQFATFFFTDRDSGVSAIEAGKIDCLYLIPAAYPDDKSIELIYQTAPGWQAQNYFAELLRINLIHGQPQSIINRVLSRPDILVHSLETQRTFSSSGPSAGSLLPTILGVIFTLSLFPISEMLVGALGDEKSNRTMEIILTSIRPVELITGKLIAVSIVVMALIAAWLLMMVAAYTIAMLFWPQKWLSNIQISPGDVAQIVLLMISGLVFAASMLIFVGAVLHGDEENKQAAGLVVMPFLLPIYILPIIIESSSSILAMLFAFLPFSSTLVIGIQSLFEAQSWWKVLTAFLIQIVCSAIFVWLSARAFKLGMLRYGQTIRLGELFSGQIRRKAAND